MLLHFFLFQLFLYGTVLETFFCITFLSFLAAPFQHMYDHVSVVFHVSVLFSFDEKILYSKKSASNDGLPKFDTKNHKLSELGQRGAKILHTNT